MSNSLVDQTKQAFLEQFPAFTLNHKQERLGNGIINCFFIRIRTAEELESTWRKVSNFIAINFQHQMEDEFEKWNLYLFYQLNFNVSNHTKYLIENDTFSSRKIIITNEENLDSIVQQHISNSDLSGEMTQLLSQGSVLSEFSPDKLLWDTLSGKVLKRKKRLSDPTNEALNSIINELRK